MKNKKKILALALALCMASGPCQVVVSHIAKYDSSISYADDFFEEQKKELEKAISDVIAIRKTKSYKMASEDAVSSYEGAVSSGQLALENESSTGKELAEATKLISEKRDELTKSANEIIESSNKKNLIKRLEDAIYKNSVASDAASYLLKYNPKSTASFKDQLLKLIETSNKLIKVGTEALDKLK